MDYDYLMTPVVQIDQGKELKSFKVYNLFVIGFIFGLVPALILCVRNSSWLRMKQPWIAALIIFSLTCMGIQYYVLGSFFNENASRLLPQDNREKTSISALLDKNRSAGKTENAVKDPVFLQWHDLKSNINLFEKACSMVLLLAAYFLTRRKYKIVSNLSGTIQPMLKWGLASVAAGLLLDELVSGLFFGGLL